MAKDDEEDDDVGLLAILQEEEEEQRENEEIGNRLPLDGIERQQSPQEYRHHVGSIASTVVIRHVPSQGLSFQLWPAASSLVSLLDRDPTPLLLPTGTPPLRILELGSGTGLVGIAAAAVLRAAVTLTDLPHVLPNLRHNAQYNAPAVSSRGGSLDVRQLRWGNRDDADALLGEEASFKFDVVLASDVVYYDELIDPLLETLRLFVSGETVFVMAHLRRWKKRDATFFRKARKLFDFAVVHSDPPLPGGRIGVVIYRFTSKALKC